ncbi:hypothetical protein PIB30_066062 [Stylosanthes scabra]|uniref:Ubiquitin-like protease family profile domain-containing protein n=1 Tax=Stylosanthes scabra TaxID=79078 RepID=A0ABU6SM79_9FABA|nr:hypothetical protein [Stylosanthes scabra]
MAMRPNEFNGLAIDYLRENYMRKYEKVSKVYIPMIRNHHWFLLIIDTTPPGTLTYVDSEKDSIEHSARISQLNYAALFLERVLEDRNFIKHSPTKKPLISRFEFIEANPPQEVSHLWEGYFTEVDGQTRMRLALDLMMGTHNPKESEITGMAISTWDKIVGRATTKLKRKKKKQAEKELHPSPSISF